MSLVTCAYNPDERLLKRVYDAVTALRVPAGWEVEYLVVDNNSTKPVADLALSRALVQNHSWASVIFMPKPGLVHARAAGAAASRGEKIVFIDEDNEPAADYLVALTELFGEHPEVGIWGPGMVEVEFVGNPEPWAAKNGLEKFQQLNMTETKISAQPLGFAFLPYGTGMAVDRAIFEHYQANVEKSYSEAAAQGRLGKVLVSSEDVELSYTAAAFGRSVGRSPKLSLKHLINEKKSNFAYLKRLYYGCSINGFAVDTRSFPESKIEKARPVADTLKFMAYNTYYLLKIGLVQGNFRQWQCQSAGMIASVEGKYQYYQKPLPLYMRLLKKYLKL